MKLLKTLTSYLSYWWRNSSLLFWFVIGTNSIGYLLYRNEFFELNEIKIWAILTGSILVITLLGHIKGYKKIEEMTAKEILLDELNEQGLQKEFESTGYASWINSDIYPDGKIYTKEYTEWLEKKIKSLTDKLKK